MEEITIDSQSRAVTDIIEKVAELEEYDPLDLPPLYESVDPDALTQLAASSEIQFEYMGYKIIVENGSITIDQ